MLHARAHPSTRSSLGVSNPVKPLWVVDPLPWGNKVKDRPDIIGELRDIGGRGGYRSPTFYLVGAELVTAIFFAL